LNGPVTHLYNVTGINFISDRALETNLKQLVKYGILTTTTGKDVLNREITYYLLNRGYSTNEKLNLPTSDEINIKKIDKQEEGSISSETSVNKGVIEDIEVKEGERSTTICKTCGLNEGKLTQDGISFYCLDCIKIERGPVIT
jgi:hypothetical protein